ncbi:MAG: hypothetical protein AABX04_02340 [Nanoarchaeota archaeon]
MKKVHGKIKKKHCLRTHCNGARVLRELQRKAAICFAKIGKKRVAQK